MKKLGLKSVIRKKRPNNRTRQKSAGHLYENVLNRDFYAENPYEKLVTDVTEFKVNSTKLYLSAILDLFNNKVVAYQLSEKNDIKLVENTLNKAFKKGGASTHTILHSDQGMQYRSNRYKELIHKYNLTPSMSRKGTCLDNACIEGFFSHFKCEAFLLYPFRSVMEAHQSVKKYMHYFNTQRYQRRLNNMAPDQYMDHYIKYMA